MVTQPKKTWVILICFWAVATAFNLTKAVHIDDTAYIEEAKYIIEDPLHPLTGGLNWYETVRPIRYMYHPLLIPYLYAVTLKIFGVSTLGLHLVMSVFTFFTTVFFFLLTYLFLPQFALYLTAMFILGPAVLPAQNLMLDIPTVATWLMFFWALLAPCQKKHVRKRYIFAGILIGITTLIKYAGFLLLVVLAIDIIRKKNWKHAWTLLIPIGIYIIWTLFNLYDYGGIHFLQAQNTPLSISSITERFLLWIIALGAVTPFTIAMLPRILSSRKQSLFLFLTLIFCLVYSKLFWTFPNEKTLAYSLRLAFFTNGSFILFVTLSEIINRISFWLRNLPNDHAYSWVILAFWFIFGSAFMIMFVPFMAVRHVLVTLPAFYLLMLRPWFSQSTKKVLYLSFVLTAGLGITLAISDWMYADVYRRQAPKLAAFAKEHRIKEKGAAQIYFAGHWGWQWYARQQGLQQYDTWVTQMRNGDYLIMPAMQSQWINPVIQPYLKTIFTYTVSSSFFTRFRLLTHYPVSVAGYYAQRLHILPWTYSTDPIEQFTIYQYQEI